MYNAKLSTSPLEESNPTGAFFLRILYKPCGILGQAKPSNLCAVHEAFRPAEGQREATSRSDSLRRA
jgi:hypothetical protein